MIQIVISFHSVRTRHDHEGPGPGPPQCVCLERLQDSCGCVLRIRTCFGQDTVNPMQTKVLTRCVQESIFTRALRELCDPLP
jgi:hypothetical protein